MNLSKGVIAYLLLSFGGAWLLWEAAFRLGFGTGSPYFQLAILPGAFAPALAALIVRAAVTREGFGDAGLRPNLRHGWKYYLLGWLFPLAAVVVISLLAVGLGLAQPDLTLGHANASIAGEASGASQAFPPWVLVVQVLLTSLLATPLLWGEEFGWRGYLQLRIAPGRPLLAALATGVIWGLWHLPVNLPRLQLSRPACAGDGGLHRECGVALGDLRLDPPAKRLNLGGKPGSRRHQCHRRLADAGALLRNRQPPVRGLPGHPGLGAVGGPGRLDRLAGVPAQGGPRVARLGGAGGFGREADRSGPCAAKPGSVLGGCPVEQGEPSSGWVWPAAGGIPVLAGTIRLRAVPARTVRA